MKRFRNILWGMIFFLIALGIFQNKDFFLAPQSLRIDLLFVNFQTPELPAAVPFIAFFFAGLLFAYFFNLSERYRARKTIKSLNSSLDSQLETISALKKDLEHMSPGRSRTGAEAPGATVVPVDVTPIGSKPEGKV